MGQWRSYSWCMWPRVHIMNVNICSMCISQVEGVYMDPIRVKVHHEANLWQVQRNLVGIGECGWMDDSGWFSTTPRYHLLGLEAQEGHLALAHKPSTFHSIMGLCSSWWWFLFLSCRWGEWDSCLFHHRDLDTYATSCHVPIWSQWAYFYGWHIWHQWCEVPFIHIDGVWLSSHKGAICLGHHKSTNMWRLGGVIECTMGKTSFTCAKLETIMFHCGWCPIRTPSIAIGCTLIFIFCCVVLCFNITLTWGFHNIFIVHGKGHGKHTNVGCTMVGLCGVEILSQFFFAHGMCWKHGACAPWKKIKDSKVRHAVLDCFHMVMFMSINPNETIDNFKARGREMVVENFDNLQLGVAWTRYFWAY